MRIFCLFTGHNLKHIANWRDIQGGRGLWQCTRCKLIHIAASSEFYERRYKEGKSKTRVPTI